jgi:hypothetical protein
LFAKGRFASVFAGREMQPVDFIDGLHTSRAHHDSFAVFPSGCGFGFIAARENGPGPPSALLLTEISARHRAILNGLLTSRCDGHHEMVDLGLTKRRAVEPRASSARRTRRM